MKFSGKTKMAKKKKKQIKKKQRSSPRNEMKDDRIVELKYEITTEPIQDRRYERLPVQAQDAIERLYYDIQKHPHQAIPELLGLIKKYPDIPKLYNFLSVAYSRAGQKEKSEKVILENYKRNPDYLFARLNYAELCRTRGDYERIAKIFDHKFDLKLLYPKRKRFHVSEVSNFMGLIGIYFLETGKRKTAKMYYGILKKISPGYSMTKELRKKLNKGFFKRMFDRSAGEVEQDLS